VLEELEEVEQVDLFLQEQEIQEQLILVEVVEVDHQVYLLMQQVVQAVRESLS
jgi:hypothetical protein